MKTKVLVESKCVSLLPSNCFDIPEAKNMSAVQRGITMKGPFVRCMANGEDIISGEVAGESSVRDTQIIKSSSQKVSKNNTRCIGEEVR